MDQIDSQVINPGPQTSRCLQLLQTSADQSNTSDSTTSVTTSEESLDTSLGRFRVTSADQPHVDTETVVTLIDLNDESNSSVISGPAQTTNSSSQVLLDITNEENRLDDGQEFNSFVTDNAGEEQIDDHLSAAPPSYEDVIDYREALSDDQPIIVDYGTL